jgi:hypothetical protein
MMHELYLFSNSIQGNFDKLADVINEKLITVLEKLTGALDDVNRKDFGTKSPEPETLRKPTDGTQAQQKPRQDKTSAKLDELSKNMNALSDVLTKIGNCVGRSGGSHVIFTHEQN